MFLLNVGAEGANPSKTLILGLSFMVFSLGGRGGGGRAMVVMVKNGQQL